MKKQKLLVAIRNTILFSAITHLIILAIVAIKDRDGTILNYFNILDLDFVWPAIHLGMLSQLLSVLTVLGLIIFFYLRSR